MITRSSQFLYHIELAEISPMKHVYFNYELHTEHYLDACQWTKAQDVNKISTASSQLGRRRWQKLLENEPILMNFNEGQSDQSDDSMSRMRLLQVTRILCE
jgi:hypothetical protein